MLGQLTDAYTRADHRGSLVVSGSLISVRNCPLYLIISPAALVFSVHDISSIHLVSSACSICLRTVTHNGTQGASPEASRKTVCAHHRPGRPLRPLTRKCLWQPLRSLEHTMVFLTTRLWLRNRLTDRYCRVREVLKHAQHFRGRKNRCYRLAVRAVTRAFVKCTQARRLKKRNLRTLWTNRITAASQEHGLQYPAFIVNLIKCQVELNRKVLADLAIYEPKTFKSLAALAKRRQQEGFAAALGDGKEPEGIFSRVMQYH